MPPKVFLLEMSQPEVEELLSKNDQVIIPNGCGHNLIMSDFFGENG